MRISKQTETELRDAIDVIIGEIREVMRLMRIGAANPEAIEMARKVEEQAATAFGLLNDGNSGSGAGAETIDRLANLLMRLTPRATLTSETVDQLRNIVLTESEKDFLQDANMKCTNCGTALNHGDSVTILAYRSNAGMKDNDVLCYRCASPHKFTLSCGCQVALPGATKKLVGKHINELTINHNCENMQQDDGHDVLRRAAEAAGVAGNAYRMPTIRQQAAPQPEPLPAPPEAFWAGGDEDR